MEGANISTEHSPGSDPPIMLPFLDLICLSLLLWSQIDVRQYGSGEGVCDVRGPISRKHTGDSAFGGYVRSYGSYAREKMLPFLDIIFPYLCS